MDELNREQAKGTLAVIGAGSMGSSMLACILSHHADQQQQQFLNGARNDGKGRLDFDNFIACVRTEASAARMLTDRQFTKHHQANVLRVSHGANVAAMSEASTILLACKPGQAQQLLSEPGVKEAVRGKLIISVMAGKTCAQLDALLYGDVQQNRLISHHDGNDSRCWIVRAMPSLAATVGESMTVLEDPVTGMPAHLVERATQILSMIGQVRTVPEDLFDTATVVVGSTPAFLAICIDGILDGAVVEGLRRSDAAAMMAQVLTGLGKLMQHGHHLGMLRESVASPKGATIGGILALEKAATRHALAQAIMNAASRIKEL